MKILRWYTEQECKEAISEFVSKFKNKNLSLNDTRIFFKTLLGVIYRSQNDVSGEDWSEIWENIKSDIEEFGSMAFCFEVWGSEFKFIIKIDEESISLGEYEGEYEPVKNVKYSAWISLMPNCQMKMMKGGLINKPELINLDCVINGSVKLVTKPRNWIRELFTTMPLVSSPVY